jgi:hypothetical protein
MLSRGSWISLPASLSSVLTDVDGRGTDLGVFLAADDLLVLRDGDALVLVLPPRHSWPSEGDRQEALRRGDRLSLPRLQLVPRANYLNWEGRGGRPRNPGLLRAQRRCPSGKRSQPRLQPH